MSLLMPHEEVTAAISKALNGRPCPIVPAVDPTMWCPSLDWLKDQSENGFTGFLRANLPEYKLHTHDCDDFSDRARFLMTECLRATGEAEGHGHSMGIFRCFVPAGRNLLGVPGGQTGIVHENNVVVCDDGLPYVFESQNARHPDVPIVLGLNLAVTRYATTPIMVPRI